MTLKKKTILILTLSLAIFVSFISFLILPTLKEIQKISKKISQVKTDLENVEKRSESIQNFKKQFPEIEENLDRFERLFVDKEFPIDFINFLEGIAQNCQILLEISLLKSEKENLSFQVVARGSPQNVFRFFEKFENSPYLIKVEKLNILKMAEIGSKEKENLPEANLKLFFSFSIQTK